MVDFNKLIPELSEWNDGAGIDVESWIDSIGNFERAIGYSTIFWPQFTEYDDCIFFESSLPFNKYKYQEDLQNFSGNREGLEAFWNHRHIWDYFPGSDGPTTNKIYTSERYYNRCGNVS